jgi:hypothetical protein
MLVLIPRIRLPNPFSRLWEFLVLLLGLPGRGLAWSWRWICTQGRALRASPHKFYLAMAARRDWVVERIEYAHTESAKWRGMWTAVKLPYTALRSLGLNPQMAIGLLAVGSTAGTGVIVNETLLAERSFARGDAGVFLAPIDIPTSYTEGDSTLLVQLGAVSVGEIEIDSISVGEAYDDSALPAGETNAIEIGGSEALSNYLEVGELIIDRWRCDTFRMEDTEAHTLIIDGSLADGLSISPTLGVVRKRAVGGGNRAQDMTVNNSTYDQIRIEASVDSVNGAVDVLRISNLQTTGGGCLISRVKAGTISVSYLVVGSGDGLAAKDMVVATSTVASLIELTSNTEELVSPP